VIEKSKARQRWFTPTAIVALAAGLRLWRAGAQSLWLDEAFSVLLAQRSLPDIVAGTAQDTMPPLYYFLLHASLVVGRSEIFARLPSAMWGIVTVLAVFGLAHELFGRRVAMLAACLLAVNPFHVFYAQEARMYTQLAALSTLAAWFFLRGWRRQRVRDWIGFAVAATLMMYTHNLAILGLLALDAFALLRWQRLRTVWRALALVHLAVGIAFLPWLAFLPGQVARVSNSFWVARPSPLEPLLVLVQFLFGHALPMWAAVAALVVALYAVALFTYMAVRRRMPTAEVREAVLFTLTLLYVPLLASFAISSVWPMFLARTLVVSSVGLMLLVAWGLTRVTRAVRLAFLIAGAAITITSLGNYYFNPAFSKPPMRKAACYLAEHYQAEDVAIHTSDGSYLPFAWYTPRIEHRFLTGDPDYEEETTRGRTGRIAGIEPLPLEAAVAGRERLWLVVALDHNIEYQLALKSRFDARYPLLGSTDVGGILIYLYAPE
jgi:mannosyltransferase